jgi:hypothetical protein
VNKRYSKSAIAGCRKQLEKHFVFAHYSSSPASIRANSVQFSVSILTIGTRAMSNHSCTPALTHHVRLPSPVPWRSRHIGREVITEWVVEKATMATVYPILTRTNYAEWSLVMRVNLQVAGMWDVINKGAGNNSEDRNTLTVLLQTVPPEMQAGLAVKNSVKEAGEVIHSMRIGVDKVKEANAERLRQEFNDISFKSGECVEDFALQISDLANQLSHWVMIFWTRKW